MAYLHSKDIIHGDLSAFNVMLTSEPPGGAGLGGRGFVAKVAGEGWRGWGEGMIETAAAWALASIATSRRTDQPTDRPTD
jgi:hypothetical protein